jgi:hypothetical protein
VSDEVTVGDRRGERWTAAHGARDGDGGDLVAADPGFADRHIELAAHPRRHGWLDLRIRAMRAPSR